MKNLKIAQELIVSFGSIILLLVIFGFIVIVQIRTLRQLHTNSAHESVAAIQITEYGMKSFKLSSVLSDIQIKGSKESFQNLENFSKEISDNFDLINKIEDTNIDKASLAKSK
jgi:hypothetical protein